MTSDSHLNPPEPCKACEEYYEYKDGLCWECYTEAQEERAIYKEEQRVLARMERMCDEQ